MYPVTSMSSLQTVFAHLLLWTYVAHEVRGSDTAHCSSTFHVWQPGQDAQQMIRDVYHKVDNLTAMTKFEIAEMKMRLVEESNRISNWTYSVDKRVFQIQMNEMDDELQQMKYSETTAKLHLQLEQMDRRVNDLERWMYNVRNKLRSSRSSNVGSSSVSGEDSFMNLPQQQGISTDLGTMLKNSVGDLKAEWILLKRDVEAVKKESLLCAECHKGRSNDTSQLSLALNQTRNETREVENKLYDVIEKQVRLEQKLNKLVGDSEHMKFQLEQQKMDYRHQETSVTSLFITTTAIQKELKEVALKMATFPNGNLDLTRDTREELLLPKHDDVIPIDNSVNHVIDRARDCHDIYRSGYQVSALYEIWPEKSRYMIPVYCQMINNTGYTVIQRRIDGSVNFNRRWSEYKYGFGNSYGEFWAGNELIHLLTKQRSYTLRVDFWTWEGTKFYAEYQRFYVEGEKDNYKLLVGEYTGDAGDSLVYHDKMAFSTEDVDNDLHERHCAAENKGGWWYNSCFYSQLNGVYHTAWYSQGQSHYADGIVWYTLKDSEFYSLKKVEMKIKLNDRELNERI
ncbi:BpsFReDn11 [Biomphalaria pfeifferi]|uniref:BpsFReDn11 n=1 Tax=Biomphalaria pfeifferi TaxID=112525 RepID=A0AAD8FQ35_BIOPF|nr:BpsFReDn11 [Biomphalaria pfeifferi]